MHIVDVTRGAKVLYFSGRTMMNSPFSGIDVKSITRGLTSSKGLEGGSRENALLIFRFFF